MVIAGEQPADDSFVTLSVTLYLYRTRLVFVCSVCKVFVRSVCIVFVS